MSITNYMREQNKENLFVTNETMNNERSTSAAASNEHRTFKILVCQPDHRNITTIFATMEHIIKDIADEMRSRDRELTLQQAGAVTAAADMTLEKFLQDFILNTFVQNAVDSITQNARIQSTIDGRYIYFILNRFIIIF